MISKYDIPAGFELSEEGSTTLIVRPDAKDAVRGFLSRPDSGAPAAEYAGRGRLCRIERKDAPAILVKQYLRGGIFRGVLKDRFLGKMRFIAELYLTEIAAKHGVHTFRIVGLAIKPALLLFKRACLFTEELRGTTDLASYCSAHADAPPSLRRTIANLAAREVRNMHNSGIYHADLHLKNILVEGDGIYIIDFDRGDYFREMSDDRRIENLMRLDRSVEKFNRAAPVITLTDRLRFLKTYCGGPGKMFELYKDLARAQMKWRKLHRLWWRIIGKS